MRIFVTGGAGFLGSWLIQSLLEDGHEVTTVDNLVGGYQDNIKAALNGVGVSRYTLRGEGHWIAPTAGSRDVRFRSQTLDIADVANLDQITSLMSGCDIVYHTAALAYEGLSVFSPTLVTTGS